MFLEAWRRPRGAVIVGPYSSELIGWSAGQLAGPTEDVSVIDVHLFDDGDVWIVAVEGTEHRFDSRGEAFRAATGLARDRSPSRIVKDPPAVRAAAGAPAAPPQPSSGATEGSGPEDPDHALLARLSPGARAAFERARALDDRGEGDGAPVVWDGDDSGVYDDAPPLDESWGARDDRGAAPQAGAPSRPTAPARSASRPSAVAAESLFRDEEPASWEQLAGPPELGRSILVPPGVEVPRPWADHGEIDLTARGVIGADLLAAVRRAFLERIPVVYRVDGPAGSLPSFVEDTSVTTAVWRVPVDFEVEPEVVWHLASANAVDARDPDHPYWPLGHVARARGAERVDAGDVALPDGRIALCDGGPLRFWPGGSIALADGSAALVVPRVTIDAGQLTPIADVAPTADLAPDQLASVGDAAARSRIVAPAGSGKTRVLTERARHLIRDHRLPARSVCMVAFNKRAQEEMRERTSDLPGLQIQTLNALALSILNGGGSFRARGERVTTIDELQVRRILSDRVQFPRRANTDPAAAWLDALSMVRLGLRDPKEVEAEFNGDVDGFAPFFADYRRELSDRSLVDFDEQIYRAIEVLLCEPDTRAAAQASCRVLLVDEFQDLAPAHLLLVRLLAGAEADVFGVGDDDQTIYGYSGARPDWLIDFDHYFPGATHHALEVNYRCPAEVVTAASNLLSHNRRRVPKEIRPGPNAATGKTVQVVRHRQPVEATAARIGELVAAGVPMSDIIVLARVNTLLAPVQAALHEAGVPVLNREGGRFLERTGVAAALAWLRLAVGSSNSSGSGGDDLRGADVERAARRPGRSLSPKVIEWMAEQRDLAGLTRLAGRLQEKDRAKVEGFASDVARIRGLAKTATTDRLVSFVRSDLGLDRAMQTLDSAHRGRNSAAHSDDLRALIALGVLHPDPVGFESWLRGALDGGRDDGGVQLSTVHRVKGLEWPHVIVHDASTGSFPHRLSTDIEEERRVFHVAITRCQVDVTIVADGEAPSMFLDELVEPAPERSAEEIEAEAATAAPTRMRTDANPSEREVVAEVGLALEWGGYACKVVEVGPGDAVLSPGKARFTVAYGSMVDVAGRPHRLVAGSTKAASSKRSAKAASRAGGSSGGVELSPEDEPVFAALKEWRLGRSKADGVPAFVVASDATLIAIARSRPSSPDELLAVNGIGPAKLELYGDEVLAVLDDAGPRSPA